MKTRRLRDVRLAALVLAALLPACARLWPLEKIPADAPPSSELVRCALADAPCVRTTAPFPAPEEPEDLRPCCAFGLDLEVDVGVIPVPAFAIHTVRGIEDIGPHLYGAGLVQATGSPVDAGADRPASENNGIVYTCRGGFLDTAHTRDYADLTWYVASRLEPALETGTTIELAGQGGIRRVVLKPVAAAAIEAAGRVPLAVAIAEWATFQLSVWREIATWYGHESVPPWPEKISSFSLEDLQSNLLGTRLAGAVLLARGIAAKPDWDRAMTAWLPAALRELGIVSKDGAAAAMRAVDGKWWDSKKRVPDWTLTMQRKFDLGPSLRPLLLEDAVAPAALPSIGCATPPQPWPLAVRTELRGVRLAEVASVELEVSDKLAGNGFPFPRAGDRRVTDEDFPMLAAAVRRETTEKRDQARRE